MSTYYRPFEVGDLHVVLNLKLRQSDRDELKASVGLDPADAILLSLLYSVEKYVVIHDGNIEAVFGVSFVPERAFAAPWFLGTDKITQYQVTFLRQSRKVVHDWLKRYHRLMNFVDSRHTESIRWLRWLGFTVDETAPVTLFDPSVVFFPFYLPKEVARDVRACIGYSAYPGGSGGHRDCGANPGAEQTG